jgi:hypothetical protein
MNIDDLTFGEIKKINMLFNSEQTVNCKPWKGEKVMIFFTHGFIFVGDLYSDGDNYTLKNAYNCRRQTEGQGWGYIAREGKKRCTVDDYQDEPLYFHKDKILFVRGVDAEKWD